MKQRKCPACGGINDGDVRYCQSCGKHLPKKWSLAESLDGDGGVILAGGAGTTGGRQPPSLGPLSKMAVQNQAAAVRQGGGTAPFTRPLDDGSWYCPRCGYHAAKNAAACTSCGYEKRVRI